MRGAALVDLCVREHGGSFAKVGDYSSFSVIVFSQLAAVLSDSQRSTNAAPRITALHRNHTSAEEQ